VAGIQPSREKQDHLGLCELYQNFALAKLLARPIQETLQVWLRMILLLINYLLTI
jgi:hypothetical protein